MKTTLSHTLVILATSLFIVGTASADCRQGYLDQIKAIDGRMNPGRGTLAANLIGAAAIPTTAAAIGVVVAPAALIATPAVAAGAGTYLFILSRKKRSFTMAYRLLVEAEKGKGPMLDKFYSQLSADDEGRQSKVRDEIVALNAKDAFCAPKGVMSKPHFLRYHAIKQMIERGMK